MPRKISLWPCGTKVTIKIGNIEAVITCQSLRFGNVQYELTYFLNDEHKKLWCNESEFEAVNAKRETIGFLNTNR